MLYKTAKKIADRLLLRQVISEETFDICVYGLELLLSSLFSVSIIFIVGCAINRFFETISFLVVFILLRSFSGGYHANTYAKCSVITFIVYGFVMLFSAFMHVNLFLYVLLLFIGAIVLYLKAPIENPNKEITEQDKKKYKIISILLFLVFCAIGTVLDYFAFSVGSTLWATLLVDILLIFFKTNYERGT